MRRPSIAWPSKRRMRLVLVLAGVVPALLAFGLLLKVGVMMTHDRDGREEFDDEAYTAAAEEFAANDRLNWFEPWISPFDEGAALHADERYDAAVERYREALDSVPAAEECTVRINLALAHEALGDIALAPPEDSEEARAQWQEGIDVLAEGECPTDSGRGEEQTEQAAAVDQRLRDKLEQEEQRQQQQQDPNRNGRGGEQKSPQEKDLDDRNQQGQDRREEEKQGGGGQRGGDQDGGGQQKGREGRGGPGGEPPGEGSTPTPTW
jgi:tetratricopeptide (TPR) repeat protein